MFLLNKVILSNFKFKNDFKSFSPLLNKIKSFDTKNLINFLFKHDFKVVLTNPLQTSHLRKTNLKTLRII